ncbi:MAG TPA: PQQ-binding-like beta-propeller repeat protein [Verrucomicrobiae bacterium]|nr:PQQ-binding-like beta-propeller repeat protein [Verrucomicrobiae bacterium]
MKHHQLILAALTVVSTLTLSAADWPQWRGPDRTDVSKETGLLKSWPEGGPKRVWLFENAGSAYSGPAIVKGKLYTLGTRDGSEVLLVLDANTGKELWTAKLGSILQNGWGDGPRGTPTVDGDRIYALSGRGDLVCFSATDGKVLWQTNMTDLGGKVPGWGYCESVLVDGNQVVCTPGGSKGTIAAFDKVTGKQNWQSTEFTDGAHYSSIMAAQINGAPQYVQLVEKNFVGISPKDGKVLWKAAFPKGRVAVIPTPIIKGNNVYVTAGYGAGCKMVAISPQNVVTTVYENAVMKNHHGGVILVGDHVYGHSDGYAWVCQDFKTGAEVWAHRDFKKGAVGYADGMLYCLEEGSGTLALVEASPKGWTEKGRFKLDPQSKIRSPQGRIWTHPVICDGKLYLRDQDLIYCYDVKGS